MEFAPPATLTAGWSRGAALCSGSTGNWAKERKQMKRQKFNVKRYKGVKVQPTNPAPGCFGEEVRAVAI